ncbi:MAG: DUF2950 family protein, partial [Chthoniobacterales bacterium]
MEEAAAVAAGLVVEVVAAVEAADVADKERYMKRNFDLLRSNLLCIVGALTIAGLAIVSAEANPTTKDGASASSQSQQKQFNTPKEAADSLVAAAQSFDVPALKEILGPDSDQILSSEDPVADKNRAMAFAAKAKEKTSVGMDSKNPRRAILTVGNDEFPLPIPIVKHQTKWVFDTKTGQQEILNRRIGANELDAIAICRGFVEAQEQYSQEKHDDSKVNQYAQRIISTPGKHDGLAWQNADGSWGGPVGQGVAKALEQGYSKQGQPYHGYYFKVLKGQGAAAPLGEMDFVIDGAMIGGFALAAAPA